MCPLGQLENVSDLICQNFKQESDAIGGPCWLYHLLWDCCEILLWLVSFCFAKCLISVWRSFTPKSLSTVWTNTKNMPEVQLWNTFENYYQLSEYQITWRCSLVCLNVKGSSTQKWSIVEISHNFECSDQRGGGGQRYCGCNHPVLHSYIGNEEEHGLKSKTACKLPRRTSSTSFKYWWCDPKRKTCCIYHQFWDCCDLSGLST